MAADIATYAKANYEHNFGMQVQGDICDIDPSTIEPYIIGKQILKHLPMLGRNG